MDEHTADLKVLAKKYRDQILLLESQLKEAKRLLSVVDEAAELLVKDGNANQPGLFSGMELPISQKYRNMKMSAAIEDVLEHRPHKKAPAGTIISELQTNGFVTTSKNFKRDVYTRLFRLEEKGRLQAKKEKGIKFYCLPKKEGEGDAEKQTSEDTK